MKKFLVLPAILAVALTGCATTDYGYNGGGHAYSPSSQHLYSYGVVESVRDVDISRNTGSGVVLGAIVGGVLGNQIGSGSGRALATAAGAVGGGYVGNRIESNSKGTDYGQEVVVRLENGHVFSVVQPGASLYRGAKVKVSGSGNNMRVHLY